jgi:hypothetical protein
MKQRSQEHLILSAAKDLARFALELVEHFQASLSRSLALLGMR